MKNRYLVLALLSIAVFYACTNNSYTPKPRGYFNIDFPKKEYVPYNSNCPFTFDYPKYTRMEADNGKGGGDCWNNLNFYGFNARLHLTYYNVLSAKEYQDLVEDARTLAFKHTVKASAIDQKLINYPEKKVYGIYYAIEGNTASSVQFFLTDSAKHYFRGALYFNERPQYDSVAPVIKFIKQDIDTMIRSFKWKN
ncbi:gliding motility lipoprotein GldD [Pedobacter sp. MC2016-14]|uniref:gliding motility lipoprotein GldD n=1 Tax=Pedobacter sp. MC2016-14 TaxID=2897327 RepID=UPI001E5D4B4B|nr:gliding motility lipoprotein GldD [Pedobacter sp. MC2016-14]MCD0487135.1 gliding motility lipoprotein GldD [Pedobacter sp. MC2016-14]